MDIERLEVLLQLYLDEGLDSETKPELEQLLLASPQAREVFWKRAKLNSMLRQLGQESWGRDAGHRDAVTVDSTQPSPTQPSPTEPASVATSNPMSRRRRQWAWATAICCLLVAGASVAALVSSQRVPDWATRLSDLNAPSVPPPGTQPPSISSNTHDASDSNVGTATFEKDSTQATLVSNSKTQNAWVAVLRKSVNVQWRDGQIPINAGEAMTARRIQFESGLVEIQTNRGAIVTLEGPADLEIVNGMEVFCRSGRLRVNVPPSAIGFLVNTPSVNVIDRGTSFALNVSDQEKTEIHVLEGLVELVSKSQNVPKRELREGESVGVSGGVYRDISLNGAAFPSVAQIRSRTKLETNRMRQAWNRRRETIAKDPTCILYFDFNEADNDNTTLVNQVVGAAASTNGTIVGGEWAEGRWPGKNALELKSAFDRVLFSVPGEHASLTCFASVRLDDMKSASTSLLMPHDSLVGGFRWQITPMNAAPNRGQLRVERRSATGWNGASSYGGEPSLRLEQLGTWIQLAFVWDGPNQVCRQYIDGVLVSQDTIAASNATEPLVLRTEQMEFGNWSTFPDNESPMWQHFSGRIDELAMFSRSLNSNEILAYHNLKQVTWKRAGESSDWNDPKNWIEQISPRRQDAVFIDQAGDDAAVYSEGTSENLNEIRVGSQSGATGELRILGGALSAHKYSEANSRVGVAGGKGTILHGGGDVTLNSLQIALDPRSRGTYRLDGGELFIMRGVDPKTGSIDIGAKGGRGVFEITGGSLKTRIGVTLGRDRGVGTFRVGGANASRIWIGGHLNSDGFWVQNTGSVLQAIVDTNGLTPILIRDVEDDRAGDGGGNVTFEKGSILDVGFADEPESGAWDVMRWEGDLTNHGLRFADSVDETIWSFELIDSNESGKLDTLRVTSTATDR